MSGNLKMTSASKVEGDPAGKFAGINTVLMVMGWRSQDDAFAILSNLGALKLLKEDPARAKEYADAIEEAVRDLVNSLRGVQ